MSSSASPKLKYKRILLKLSGEQLMGEEAFGIAPNMLDKMAGDVAALRAAGAQVGLVLGGGNLFRGAALSAAGLDRVTGDHMGMLATVMNALAMRGALERAHIPCTVMSAITMDGVADIYDRRRAVSLLERGQVVIFSAGTGNPFFTTDSAACLRAIETDCALVLKATKVDGVYSDDPMKNPEAQRFTRLSYDKVLLDKLAVMDMTAICLCRDHSLPIRVFQMNKSGALLRIIAGEDEGTLIQQGEE